MTDTLGFFVGYYLLVSICSFTAYGYDKHQAKRGRWRVRESTLHKIDWLGGWPGGWFARRYLRHKSIKPAFRRIFLLTMVAHLAFWILVAGVWWRWSTGDH